MLKRSKFLTVSFIVMINVVILFAIVLVLSLGGMLSSPPTLVFRSNSAQTVYDGSTLSDDGYRLLSGSLRTGHRAEVDVTGMQSGVGKSENRIYVTIVDSFGADVSEDYNIILEYGLLEIKPRTLGVSTDGATQKYTGKELTNGIWNVTTPEILLPGDTVHATTTGSQTEIGSSFNYARFSVYDSDGQDVTYNYDIDAEYGILTVTKIDLNIFSYPYTTQFGEIAECDEYGYNEWELLPGHKLSEVVVTGRQEMPGSSLNTIEAVSVIDKDTGEDVTDLYYNIVRREGLLTVEPYNYNLEGALAYLQLMYSSGRVYLKDQSFGQYMGDGWAYGRTYNKTYNGYSADYLTGSALKNSGIESNAVSVSWNCPGFGLPYYMATGELNGNYDQWRDTLYGSKNKAYTVEYYSLGVVDRVYEQTGDLAKFEKEYRNHVYKYYLSVGDDDTEEYMRALARENGFVGKDLETIYAVAQFIQDSAKYDVLYDKALDSDMQMGMNFLKKYKSGVCRHYATAATLMYRAMGIPARYTEGFAIDLSAGQTAGITANMRHAWVEVYIDGMGWISVEVTGYIGEANNNIQIVFESDSYKLGTERPEIRYTGFEEYEKLGYIFVPELYDIPEEYGKYKIGMSDYTVYDPQQNDVTDSFVISQQTGIMQIYREVIYVDSYGEGANRLMTYTYDGKLHTAESFHYDKSILDKDSRTLYCTPIASIVNIGEIPATFTAKVLDDEGTDVTNEYRIIKSYGKIKVEPRKLVFKVSDVTAVYDGTEHRATRYELIEGSLVQGDILQQVFISGTRTEPGVSEAVITGVQISSPFGVNVSQNYSISCVPGKIKIIG